jgi:SAM-dependent methyltransferase
MRTAADFDAFYGVIDPWQTRTIKNRNRIFKDIASRYLKGKRVLELGCGEGYQTQLVFDVCSHVTGVDISQIAINRANGRKLSNATFMAADFIAVPFAGFDAVTAIECVYYLSEADQHHLFEKLARENSGKLLVFSAPIIGENEHRVYYTHSQLTGIFSRYQFSLLEMHNLNTYRKTMHANRILATLAAALVRLPFGYRLLPYLPESMVYQRAYVLRC